MCKNYEDECECNTPDYFGESEEQTLKKWTGVAEFEEELTMSPDQIRIKELTAEVERLNNAIEYTGAHLKSWAEKWARASKLYEASLEESGVDTDDLGENDRALVQMFGIEFTEEVCVTFTQTWSSYITVKKGADLSGLEVESDLPYDLAVTLDGETHYLGNDYEEFDY